MNVDDIVYISLLVSCILFGQFYRNVLDPERAKVVGTAFGLLIVCVVSGWHALHPLLSTAACAAIILFVDKRYAVFAVFVCLLTLNTRYLVCAFLMGLCVLFDGLHA